MDKIRANLLSELTILAKKAGWQSLRPMENMTKIININRSTLIKRLLGALEKQITLLESKMADPGEKEVALLGTITRNLEKLIDLDQKELGRNPGKKRSRELDELRQKLTDRIEQLQKD